MNRYHFVAGLASAVMLLVLPLRAQAGSIFHFSGKNAQAFFTSLDSTNCVETDVFVFAEDTKFQQPPGRGSPESDANLGISKYDSCTQTQLINAFGFAFLGPTDLQIVRTLGSATLNTTIDVFDSVSGNSFSVSVSLTWTAFGVPTLENFHDFFKTQGFIVDEHFHGTTRAANASGTVSDGTTNFTPQASIDALLASVRSGSVFIGQ
jgi:hypothetical protein